MVLLGWTGASQAANCAQGSVEATRHFYSHGSPSRWYQGDYLSDQQTAQKASAEYDRMPGIDLAHIFSLPLLRRACCAAAICSHFVFVHVERSSSYRSKVLSACLRSRAPSSTCLFSRGIVHRSRAWSQLRRLCCHAATCRQIRAVMGMLSAV